MASHSNPGVLSSESKIKGKFPSCMHNRKKDLYGYTFLLLFTGIVRVGSPSNHIICASEQQEVELVP